MFCQLILSGVKLGNRSGKRLTNAQKRNNKIARKLQQRRRHTHMPFLPTITTGYYDIYRALKEHATKFLTARKRQEKWAVVASKEQIILLGKPSKTTFYRWKKGESGDLSQDTLERVSYLLGIYKALRILFTSKDQANSWIHRENSANLFAGKSALDFMLHGKMANLFETRKYLDAQRGY